jgi:gluconolactonase
MLTILLAGNTFTGMITNTSLSRWVVLGMALMLAGCAVSGPDRKIWHPVGKIERMDPAADKLLAPHAELELLATGFTWSEGPVWMPEMNAVLFSDIPRNTIWKWSEKDGLVEFMNPAGYTGKEPRGGEPGSNGLTRDSEGRLVMCEHGDRRVSRVEKDGKKTTLADRFEGKRLNSPNDLAFKSNGDLYFTDPPYGLVEREKDPKRELDFFGVYRRAKDGKLTLLTKDVTRPNGIAFSPDEKKLYVASSDPDKAVWMVFDVQADGTIANGKVFYDATDAVKAGKKGLPDGMKVDKDGNIFATGPGGIYILSPDAKLLAIIDCGGEPTANLNWGEDGSVLYVTSNMNLCRIRTLTKGKGW